MQAALEISYHNIDDAQSAGETVRAYVEYLEQTYESIATCRVHVARKADNDNHLALPAVLIELCIPGQRDVVVAHAADRTQDFEPDVSNAIHAAFHKAELALRDLRRIREINSRIAEQGGDLGFLGEVAEIYPLEDYGYLLNRNGERVFFHRDAIVEGDFDYLVRGAQAYYVEENGDAGPLVTKIWIADAAC